MHVLILPSWYPYASRPLAGIFFREQALALRSAGYQVGVVAPIFKSFKEIRFIRDLPNEGPYWEDDGGVATLRDEHWSIPKLHRLNMLRWLRCGKRLVHQYIAIKGRPDIVHAHALVHAGTLAAIIKQSHQIPYVITEHSTAYARRLIFRWQMPYIRAAIHEAAWRMAVSQELAQLLEALVPVPGVQWNYVPNMVDIDFFSPPSRESSANSKRPFIFFSAAFLTAKKGMHFLISAFAKTFSGTEAELWIGGEGEERRRLEDQTALLGAEKKIRFLGSLNREQMLATMQRCDAFVLPSLYETFGVVLIEALAAGKPVIATKCGGPESIVHEGNGFLVAPADPDALGAAMQKMVESINRFDKCAMRADCIRRFSRQAVVEELDRVYRLVIGAKQLNK